MTTLKRKRNGARIVSIILAVVCIASAVVVGFRYYGSTVSLKLLQKKVEKNNTTITTVATTEANAAELIEKTDYSPFIEENQDFVGWINVPDTKIDYPVVQGDDNSHYLTTGFDGKYSAQGSVFMDYRNNAHALGTTTVLYAHNLIGDDQMFDGVENFEEMDWAQSHPTFTFNTIEQNQEWVVIGCFMTSVSPEDDNGYVFNYVYEDMSGVNFPGFMNEVNQRSFYNSNVDVNENDNILMLSTCTRKLDIYKNGIRTYKTNARVVLVARALRPGEEIAPTYTENTPKMPQVYYDMNNIENPWANAEKWYPVKTVA